MHTQAVSTMGAKPTTPAARAARATTAAARAVRPASPAARAVRPASPAARALRVATLALCLALGLAGCGGGGGGATGDACSTSGEAFEDSGTVTSPDFDDASAVVENDGAIDTSNANAGVVMAHAKNKNRLKFVVRCGEMSYNYDLPGDDTPITCPINMGDGSYTFLVMRNTGGDNYVQTTAADANVELESEFAPFTQPNVFCNYTDESACVAKAHEIVASAENQGDAVQAICTYVVDNVDYDTEKAEKLSGTSGYVPNPDETFDTGKGVCFDYASLGAAMLRSVGIPAKIITGYVSPDDLYHAWVMVYIDGSWECSQFSVLPESWSRVDLTLAAGSQSVELVGDGTVYTERYVY